MARKGTTVNYNGVQMFNVLTRDFVQEVIYDDSGTDAIGHKFRMRFQGMVHVYPDSYALANGTELPPTQISTNTSLSVVNNEIALRRQMMEPRGVLEVKVGTAVLLRVEPETHNDKTIRLGVDIGNGPKPQSLSITKITGTNTFQVEFAIDAMILECATLNNASGVLSNRWSMTESYDQDWYATRTINGTLRVKSIKVNPMFVRELVTPPIQSGFKREARSFVVSPDGLSLQYTVTDRQVYAQPPHPATTWEATHSVYSGDNAVMYGEVNISVTGPPDVDRVQLIELACAIASAKLLTLSQAGAFLHSARIVDYMHINRVDLSATMLYNKGQDPSYTFVVRSLGLGKHLDDLDEESPQSPFLANYQHAEPRIPKVYGSATPAGLFTSYLQSPCNGVHGIQQVTGETTPNDDTEKGEDWTPFMYEGTVPTDPEIESNYDESNRYPYTYYRVDVQYLTNENVVQLPIARAYSPNSTDATCRFINLAGPTCQRIVKIAAERMGEEPERPRMDREKTIGTLYMRLLSKNEIPKAPMLGTDGKTLLHSFDAEYVYGLSREPRIGTEEYQIGRLPWIADGKSPSSIPSSVESDRIVD